MFNKILRFLIAEEISELEMKDVALAVDVSDFVLGKITQSRKYQLKTQEALTSFAIKLKWIPKQLVWEIGCIFSRENAWTYMKLNNLAQPNVIQVCDKIGIIKTIAVSEDYLHSPFLWKDCNCHRRSFTFRREQYQTMCEAKKHKILQLQGQK